MDGFAPGVCGVFFGLIVSTTIEVLTTGSITVAHGPHWKVLLMRFAVLGFAAAFGVAGAALAWRAPLSRVRIVVTIIGVVVTSVVGAGVWISWSASRLLSPPPGP